MSVGGGGDYLPPVIAELIGNADQFKDMLHSAMSDLAEFAAMDTTTGLYGNISPLEQKLAQAKAALDMINLSKATAVIGADDSDLETRVKAAIAMLSALDRMTATVKITADSNVAGAAGAGAATALAGAGGAGGGAGIGVLSGLLWGGGSRGIPGMLGLGGGMAGLGSLGMFAGLGPEHLLMTMLGLGGNLGGGALGGGLLAAGSLATSAVGMGTDMAGLGQATNDAKAYNAALDQLNKAIAIYGAGSTQAAHAQNNLNFVLSGFPTVAQSAIVALSATTQQFKTQFDAATGLAEKRGAEILTQLVHVGEKFLPIVGSFAAQNMSIIQTGLQPLFSWITTQGVADFTILERKFQSDLPTAIHAFDQGLEFTINTLTYLSNYTGGFISTLDRFFTKMNTPVEFSKWKGDMQNLIGDFENWKSLVDNLIKDIYYLFHNDAGTATSIVDSLNQMLIRLGDWEQSTRGSQQIQNIFVVHKQEILELLQMLPTLASGFASVYLAIAPTMVALVNAILPVINAFAHNPFGAWLLGLGLVLNRMNILSPALQGIGIIAQSAMTSMGLMAEKTVAVEGASAAAAGASGVEGLGLSLGALAGPVGIAVGALTIGLGGALLMLMHNGPTAAQKITSGFQQMSQQLSALPAGNILQMASNLDTVNRDIGAITYSMGLMKAGSTAFDIAAGKLQALHAAGVTTLQDMVTMNSNVNTLAKTFGISNQDIINFANEVGINLKQSLDPTQVEIMSQAIQASGETFNIAATKPPNWAAAVADAANKSVASAKHGNATLNADAQEAMALHTLILKNGGALGIAAFANAQSGGLNQVIGVAKAYGITIPSQYLGLLENSMGQGGIVSVQRLTNSMASKLAADMPTTIMEGGRLVTQGLAQIQASMAAGGYGAGAALTNGMAAAIMAGAGSVNSASYFVAAKSVQLLRQGIGAASPSRLSYETGLDLMAGLTLGILAGQRGSNAASSAAAAQVIASMNAARLASSSSPGGVASTVGGHNITIQQSVNLSMVPSAPSTTLSSQVTSGLDTANAGLLQSLKAL